MNLRQDIHKNRKEVIITQLINVYYDGAITGTGSLSHKCFGEEFVILKRFNAFSHSNGQSLDFGMLDNAVVMSEGYTYGF